MATLPTPQDTAAGSLDERLVPKLTQFFVRVVARAAVEAGATIVDGGTQAGVMALMGEGMDSHGFHTGLLGSPKRLPAGTPIQT